TPWSPSRSSSRACSRPCPTPSGPVKGAIPRSAPSPSSSSLGASASTPRSTRPRSPRPRADGSDTRVALPGARWDIITDAERRRRMTPHTLAGLVIGLVLLSLAGCGPSTQEDLIAKARGVTTRAELEKALGKPSDISKLGPMETWTYKASNGQVVFVVLGDAVTLEAAGP